MVLVLVLVFVACGVSVIAAVVFVYVMLFFSVVAAVFHRFFGLVLACSMLSPGIQSTAWTRGCDCRLLGGWLSFCVWLEGFSTYLRFLLKCHIFSQSGCGF